MYFSGITSHFTPATVTDDSTCSKLRPRFVPCIVTSVPPSGGPVRGTTYKEQPKDLTPVKCPLSPHASHQKCILVMWHSNFINFIHEKEKV